MASVEASGVEMLYEHGQRLSEAKEIAKHENDYLGILAAAKASSKTKQLAAQLIPRFFKSFPGLSSHAMNIQLDLCEEDELGIRVQAIRGLPLLCKDTPGNTPKIIDVLGQLLIVEESLEKDAVQKALMMVIRQDTRESLKSLFSLVESFDESIRQKVLIFLKEKVFPSKQELLQGSPASKEDMERFMTELIKKVLHNVTGAEFKLFIDFLKSLSIFGEKASIEQVQELLTIVEGQAGLDADFNVSDTDHVERLMSCFHTALPIYMQGAPISKFLNYINRHLFPVFEKLPEDTKVELLKNLAESSACTTAQDARQLLPSVCKLLKRYMPIRRTSEEINLTLVECLLFTFHQLAHKTPNTTNSLCGYKIVTGQPSDRLGEDFSELFKDFIERLKVVEDIVKATSKKLSQMIGELGKERLAAKDDSAMSILKAKQLATVTKSRACNNILTLTKPLHERVPSFINDKNASFSWKAHKSSEDSPSSSTRTKRTAAVSNGTGPESKRGRGNGAPAYPMERSNARYPRGGRGWARGIGRGGMRGGRGRRTGVW